MINRTYAIPERFLPWILQGNGSCMFPSDFTALFKFMKEEGLEDYQYFRLIQQTKGDWNYDGNKPMYGYSPVTDEMTQVVDIVWVWKENQ